MKNLYTFLLLLSVSGTALCQSPSAWQPRGVGGGGSMFFPTINPANDNEFYVACDMSELFHSTDYGLSYSQVHFKKLQVANTSMYQFTNNANIAYCTFNNGNNIYAVKTTDGGASWDSISGYDYNYYGDIYKLIANYDNPQQLLIDAFGDILFSNNGGASFTSVKHTVDNGTGLIMGGVFWDSATGSIYIGTNEGLIYSNNNGGTFQVMTTTGIPIGQKIFSFAGARTSGSLLFACVTADSLDVYNGIMPYDLANGAFATGVYTMDDATGTWVSKSNGINFSNDLIPYIAMSWYDISTIYLGGKDLALGAPLVYKSSNAGTTWTKKFNTTNNANIITGWQGSGGDKGWSWDEMCFGISVAPNNSNKVMFGNYGDVQLSSDGGNTWRQAYVSAADQHPAGAPTPKSLAYHSIGMENTTCWQVVWADANKMMGCFSDIGGIRSLDGGVSWGYQSSGISVNSLYRVVKITNGNMYGATSNFHDMYQSTWLADARIDAVDPNGKVYYSTDSGATWTSLHYFGHPVFWIAGDPNNQSRMYASVVSSTLGGLYRCDNLLNYGASMWTKQPNPPRTEGHPASIVVLNDGKVVCTFSGRRNSSGTFTASSGVFIYDPVSITWTDVSDNGMKYWTKDIIIDPSDPNQNTWYVCVFSGWGGLPNGKGGLYKTTNRGGGWTKLTGAMFDRVTSITFNPSNLNQAFLTTETQGLWMSTDMNATTPTWSLVNSYPFRQPERVYFNPYNPNEMWVTSFGNGMKVGYLNVTGIEFKDQPDNELAVYPNPSSNRISIKLKNNSIIQSAQIMDMSGRKVLAVKNPGESIDISSLAAGQYIVTVYTDEKNFRRMIVKTEL